MQVLPTSYAYSSVLAKKNEVVGGLEKEEAVQWEGGASRAAGQTRIIVNVSNLFYLILFLFYFSNFLPPLFSLLPFSGLLVKSAEPLRWAGCREPGSSQEPFSTK